MRAVSLRSVKTGVRRLSGACSSRWCGSCDLCGEPDDVRRGLDCRLSCRKLTCLIDLASMFKLPMIHLEDCPGFLIGKESEESATIRYGTEVLVALRESEMPYCTVVVRKAFGVVGAANRKPGSESFRLAWPQVTGGRYLSREASKLL